MCNKAVVCARQKKNVTFVNSTQSEEIILFRDDLICFCQQRVCVAAQKVTSFGESHCFFACTLPRLS